MKKEKIRGVCPVTDCGKQVGTMGTRAWLKYCRSHARGGGVPERKAWQKSNNISSL